MAWCKSEIKIIWGFSFRPLGACVLPGWPNDDIQLAAEIKTIDDAIADCTEKITQEIRSQYKR
jgi:hypothetical protein